jgi:hypothetical protein
LLRKALKRYRLSTSDIDEDYPCWRFYKNARIADENSLVKASKGLILMKLLQLNWLFKVEFYLEM